MAIVGLTDRRSMKLPIIGRLHKGEEKKEDNKPGKDLPDYFRFTSDIPGVAQAFYETYGEQPNELTFFFAYPEMDKNWQTCKEKWLGGRVLHHRCDGEWCSRWIDTQTGKYITAGQNGVEPMPCPGDCVNVGRLSIVLPSLVECGFVGTVTVETHAINDIVNIDDTLFSGEILVNQWGWKINQVPWFLYRNTKTIGRPRTESERKKYSSLRGTTDKSLVFVAPDSGWASAQIKALQDHARAILPAPSLELVEQNDQMRRETTVLVPPRRSGNRFLKAEDPQVTAAQARTIEGAIVEEEEEIPFSDPPEGPEEDFEIPQMSSKDDFWAWAQAQFPDMDQNTLKDACRTITQKAGTFEDAAKELLGVLAG